MRWFVGSFVKAVLFVCTLSLSFAGSVNAFSAADDDKPKTKSASTAADAAKNVKSSDLSSGLTERERMLLDRVEQLEKRVAELESQRHPSGQSVAAATAAPSPNSLAVTNGALATAAPASALPAASASAPAPTEAASDVQPTPSAATRQTEKGNAAKKASASEPFAFADFTWLNG